ncbi:ABC transporter permease [Corynebacterium sp. 13CS0277]|uniref:ABC transporter permease n=1 Tax=Corynebacterium sp. 13CS0277 TaxID=2071994 RepID=UPI000D0400AA|nr:ABC transporter permease [Corynebacterium sp. 13CS0277]PRQ12599.1 ABC transporter permease [Corynebacterium sp. 13CS0277]
MIARLARILGVILAAFTLAFVLLSALPGDAVQARYANPDLGLSPQQVAEIRAQLGADKPLLAQYLLSLGGFLTGDFGVSVTTGTPVREMIAAALPGTVLLAASAFVTALVFTAMIAAAVSFSPRLGRWARALPPLMSSVPTFLVGIILIQWVSFRLGLVPIIGASPAQELILPTITLAIPIAAPMAQVLLRSIDEISSQSFVDVSRARGASTWRLTVHQILPAAILPALTVAGLAFGELVGGAVVTEAVFGRAGLGQMTVDAVSTRDTPVLLAIVVLAATVYVLINAAVDALQPLIDPRLRKASSWRA